VPSRQVFVLWVLGRERQLLDAQARLLGIVRAHWQAAQPLLESVISPTSRQRTQLDKQHDDWSNGEGLGVFS
jgi:hypothetical protein